MTRVQTVALDRACRDTFIPISVSKLQGRRLKTLLEAERRVMISSSSTLFGASKVTAASVADAGGTKSLNSAEMGPDARSILTL